MVCLKKTSKVQKVLCKSFMLCFLLLFLPHVSVSPMCLNILRTSQSVDRPRHQNQPLFGNILPPYSQLGISMLRRYYHTLAIFWFLRNSIIDDMLDPLRISQNAADLSFNSQESCKENVFCEGKCLPPYFYFL